MGEHGIIVYIVAAIFVAVIGGSIVQLIKRVYIDTIDDVKPVAAILTVLLSGLLIAIFSFLLLFAITSHIIAGVAGTILGGATAYYLRIFNSYGLESATPEQRQKFDSFKAQLEAGGRAAVIYEMMLTSALNAVDRFFGDADPAVKTLWPRAFGFGGRAPFWTAPSYDRCLLIALLYPLVMIFAVWGYSGHVGPGEAALGLPEATEGLRRLLVIAGMMMIVLCDYAFAKAKRWPAKMISSARIFAVVVAVAVAFAVGGVGVVSFVVAVVFAFAFTGAVAGAIAMAVAFTCSFAFAIAYFYAYVMAVAGFIAVLFANDLARKRGWHGRFLLLFTVFYLLICYASAWWLGGAVNWQRSGSLILFVGLLTLINAPFDWLTLGLTRALLRRGLELGGWWPLLLAIADLVMAAVVIVLLAVAMVVAVDAFNAVTISAGGENVFDLAGTLNGLADPTRRSEPEYWWLYATLFSTLIPSIINIAIGALSVMRGLPGFHRIVAGAMTPGRGVLGANLWMAPALALEVLVSIIIGTAAPLGLLWVLFGWLLPAFGTGLIPWLRVVEGLV